VGGESGFGFFLSAALLLCAFALNFPILPRRFVGVMFSPECGMGEISPRC
jgi:hypothetical protein